MLALDASGDEEVGEAEDAHEQEEERAQRERLTHDGHKDKQQRDAETREEEPKRGIQEERCCLGV